MHLLPVHRCLSFHDHASAACKHATTTATTARLICRVVSAAIPLTTDSRRSCMFNSCLRAFGAVQPLPTCGFPHCFYRSVQAHLCVEQLELHVRHLPSPHHARHQDVVQHVSQICAQEEPRAAVVHACGMEQRRNYSGRRTDHLHRVSAFARDEEWRCFLHVMMGDCCLAEHNLHRRREELCVVLRMVG